MDRPAANHVSPALLVRIPMGLVAAAMAPGIVIGRFGPFSAGTYSLLAAAGVLIAATSFFRKHLSALTTAALAVAIASLAASYVLWRTQSVSPEHIVRRTSRTATLATVRGRVVTSPVQVADDPSVLTWPRPPRTVCVLRAESIRAGDDWRPARGLVRVTITEADDRLLAGQRVELQGWIGRLGSPGNPGQFDYARWAAAGGLHVRLSVPSPGAVTIRSGRSPGWFGRVLWRLRASARQHLLASGDEREGKLLTALILGERDPSLRTLSAAMVRAGIAHFLSISGMHLGIFLGFVFLLCRLAMLSPRRSAAVVLGVLIGYLLLAEPRPPLLRSAIMAGSLCLGAMLRRRAMPHNALATAAAILLIADPMNLFDAGFQLSFAIVGGVLVLHRPVRGLLFGRWIRRRGLMVFRREQSVRRWLTYRFADWAMSGVVIALTAYVAAAPLVAHHFGLFTPWAPLLSVLLLPVIVAILVPGYISLMLAWPMPNFAHAVGRLSAAAADWLADAVTWFDRLPGVHVELRPVGAWSVVLAYAVIALAAAHRRVRLGRVALAAGVVILIGAAAWTQRTASRPDVAELHLLDIGAGQCALLRTPSGRTVLIDAGSQTRFELAERIVRPFINARRLPWPTAAFVSHANTDHYNALPNLLARGPISTVYLNAAFGRRQPGLEIEPVDVMMKHFRDGDVEVVRLAPGQTVALDDRTTVEALWPPADISDAVAANDRSLVLRVVCDGRSVLLPGDVQAAAQRALLVGGASLAANVLVLPHHGAWAKTLPEFVRAVDPEVVLISTDQSLDERSTSEDRQVFFDSLRHAAAVYSTDEHGWIRLRFGVDGLAVRTMRDGP